MTKKEHDILDDEFRVIGGKKATEPNRNNKTDDIAYESRTHKKLLLYIGIILCFVLVAAILIYICMPYATPTKNNRMDSEQYTALEKIDLAQISKSTVDASYTEYQRDTINDIPLDIFIPHNAVAELTFGPLDLNDTSIIFIASAADIRADNGYPVGAFVMKGQPISGGIAKIGYCSIIDEQINIGVSENSPLFEESTKKNGYFFRQFPLVDKGQIVENEARGKSIRKAICKRGNEIFVVMTASNESYHDFAQALSDFQVEEAVALVGSVSFGGYRDLDGNMNIIYPHLYKTKYENFIIWRKK